MSEAVEEGELSARMGQPLYGGNVLFPSTMEPKFRINATEILYEYPSDTEVEENYEKELLDNDEIEFISPVRIRRETTIYGLKAEIVDRVVTISLPPGGVAKLKNGPIIVNGPVDRTSSVSMYAFCPKCSEWWVKRTAGRPHRCPNCMERLDKYQAEEIELDEVLEKAVAQGRKRI